MNQRTFKLFERLHLLLCEILFFCLRLLSAGADRRHRVRLEVGADWPFVQDHLFAGFGLTHVFILQDDRAFDGHTLVAFSDGSCPVTGDDVASDTSLDQERISSGVIRSEVKVFADSKVSEIHRISLHLKEIVHICAGQVGHLNRSLSSSLP